MKAILMTGAALKANNGSGSSLVPSSRRLHASTIYVVRYEGRSLDASTIGTITRAPRGWDTDTSAILRREHDKSLAAPKRPRGRPSEGRAPMNFRLRTETVAALLALDHAWGTESVTAALERAVEQAARTVPLASQAYDLARGDVSPAAPTRAPRRA